VIERGIASWYGPQFNGRRTANGERYDMHAMTAAHKSLPFGTVVEIRDLDNGRTCRVRINDRGPFVRGRVVDLSYAAARALDMVGPGTAHVELAVVTPGEVEETLPAEPVEVPAASAPTPSQASVTAFTVQVGAFGEAARAETLRDLLARHFPDATVRSDGTWNRVQVGRFASRSEAERFRRKLERLGWAGLVVAAR
jgi:rare lipoprotein A